LKESEGIERSRFRGASVEAGNMLAKQLEYLAEAEIAGIVLGARVPIILTSLAAIALLLARRKKQAKP
jgi:hypothetical protein